MYHFEYILAGMWGGLGQSLPNINNDISQFLQKSSKIIEDQGNAKYKDQIFLRELLYPRVQYDQITHDSY